MGIVKIVSGESAVNNGSSCGDDEDLTKEERMLLQSFPSHESDDCECAEVGCELAVSRGQICNIPYELYDMPELTEVLSLETWNLCLTEDDRFHLAAYLPDMEQDDFCTTLKELFSGDVMFFESPLRSFFYRLNSGFYSPKVSQARELLMILQRRRHYHSLKLYHDGMVGKFASMDKLLRSSDTSASLQEMVSISHTWGRYEKRFPSVGLGGFTVPIIVEGEAATFSPLKRAKLMDGTLSTHCSTKYNEAVHIAKAVEMNSSEGQIFQPSNEPRPNCSKLPKGGLKIRTGCASLTDGSEGIHHTPGLVLVDQLGMQSSSVYTPPHAFAHGVHGFAENLSSRINTIRSTPGSSRSSPLRWTGALAMMAKSPLGVQMIVPEELKAVYPSVVLRGFYQRANNHSSAYASEAYDTRESLHMKNLLKNFGRQNSIVHESSDPYTGVSDGYQMNGYMTMHSLRNPESTSEMLNLSTRVYPPYSNFSEQLETMREHHDGLKLKTLPAKSVTRVEGAHPFPYTYSRRQHRSLDIVDPVKSSTMVEDTVSPSMLAGMANMKTKAIKL
uniref:DEUBAD domain-containing protein n=1 Tax=Arundo donax TaxID=35708 RepID=A0A0A9BT41_ARUDO